eukprot:3583572-Rhodomonas_salina.2
MSQEAKNHHGMEEVSRRNHRKIWKDQKKAEAGTPWHSTRGSPKLCKHECIRAILDVVTASMLSSTLQLGRISRRECAVTQTAAVRGGKGDHSPS